MNNKMKKCHTCELISRRDQGKAPLWDRIYRTDCWDIVHCYGTALPGWIVLVVKRHLTSIDEMSEEEAEELGQMLRRVSIAIKQVVGCEKTYVLQFAEHPDHSHVHFHVVPRMKDQPEERKATKIMGYLSVPESEEVAEEVMNGIANKVRKILISFENE